MRKMLLAAAAATAMISTAAYAAVTFDADTGTGFVGKGDVQLAFGWNNAALQKNAAGVTFVYNAVDTYEAICTWTTGEGTRGEKTHNGERKRTSGVNSSIAYDARVRNQITGFNLTGFRETSTIGQDAPVVGDPCPGNQGHEGVWTSVEQTGSTGGLFVNYGGNAVQIDPALTL
jgi:hypothetical protein